LVAERDARAVLFAGDDVGDLPAYEAVEALRAEGVAGVAVCAVSAEVPAAAERADMVVSGPAGVVSLLDALVAAIGTGG
jgi:trehalose 6-phosphate phosphatase